MKVLDLFCGAGGCSVGYRRAGFTDITGVDLAPMPRYPFDFVQGDALEYVRAHGHEYDFIHASPVCKGYSVANNIHGRSDHPLDIPMVRAALQATGKPYAIENVPGAAKDMASPVVVCGLALGCNVKRHRLFESNLLLSGTDCPPGHPGDWLLVFGHTTLTRGKTVGRAKGGGPSIRRKHVGVERGREAMGIDWMTRDELSQAIPPAYTEFVGSQVLLHLEGKAA